MIKSILHSGANGDLIYGLYIVNQLKCENFYVGNKYITPEYYKLLLPLLQAQPYIKNVEYVDSKKEVEINLDCWRKAGRMIYYQHIVLSHILMLEKVYKIKLEYNLKDPWIYNVPKLTKPMDYICVNRSFKWHVPFPYDFYIKDRNVVFCGLKEEFEYFSRFLAKIKYYHPKDFLDFAKVIQGSKFFLGNQSVGSAIAQGLAHPQVQEICFLLPNCVPYHTPPEYGVNEEP